MALTARVALARVRRLGTGFCGDGGWRGHFAGLDGDGYHHPLLPGGRQRAVDVQGGQDGVVNGNVTYSTGASLSPGDQAFHFDGSGANVDLGATVGNVGISDFTVSLDTRTAQGAAAIIGNRLSCYGGDFWSIRSWNGGHVLAEIYGALSYSLLSNDIVFAAPGTQWHHIVMTRSGTELSLNVDGQFEGSLSTGTVQEVHGVNTVAGTYACVTVDGTANLNGDIDNLRVDVGIADSSPPTLTLPTTGGGLGISGAATSAAGAVVTYTVTATDNSGLAPTASCSPPSGLTFPVGSTTVTCTATDGSGNTATGSFPVTVTYPFGAGVSGGGFAQPVDNPPTENTMKAGAAVPVKFSLGGNMGLAIFAANTPTSQQINCSTTAPLDAIEQTVTAGNSSLAYDPTSGLYSYIWKTDKAWAGTCRRLTITLTDGTTHPALFKFN